MLVPGDHGRAPLLYAILFFCAVALAAPAQTQTPTDARAPVPASRTVTATYAATDEPDEKTLPNFHKVSARLFRGAQPRAGGMEALAALGIDTVINLRDDDERARAEEREARRAGLRYFNIPLARFSRPSHADVERVLRIVDAPENGKIFLHCRYGADRTGTVVAIYRITRDGWTSEQALEEADEYGMRFWQRGMKNYIRAYARSHAAGR